jgi:putative ABC transport system permease protein
MEALALFGVNLLCLLVGWGVIRMRNNILTALVQIWANKSRALLTTLGIVIAVSSIITVVALVEGFGNYMQNLMRGYGTQYMVVHPYMPRGARAAGMGRLSMDLYDVQAVIGECDHVQRVSPFVFASQSTVRLGEHEAEEIPVRGVSEHYQVIRNFRADAGRFFGPIDIENASQVVVLGRTVMTELHCDEGIIGQHVHIDDMRFLVIGLLESKGNVMRDDQDKTVMIPYTTAIKLYPQLRDRVAFLAEATSEDHIASAEAQITRVLRQRHRLQLGQPNDFYVSRQDEALDQLEELKAKATVILAGIVSISLLVGGIGIMNVMFVAVTERTHEIGLRKSVGGRRRDILLQFLTEAVVLCSLGGMIGVGMGYGVTLLAGLHPAMVPLSVPHWAITIALVFSAGTGIVFGLIPAMKAAIVHPIDALRHE